MDLKDHPAQESDIEDAISLSGDEVDTVKDIELRIECWLSNQGIKRCSIIDKQDEYSNRQKSLSLSTNASTVSPFNLNERMNRSSLLKRRNLKLGIQVGLQQVMTPNNAQPKTLKIQKFQFGGKNSNRKCSWNPAYKIEK